MTDISKGHVQNSGNRGPNFPQKVSARRATSVEVTSSCNEKKPNKLSVRRVTFSDVDDTRLYFVDMPPNYVLRRENYMTIAEQIRTQTKDCVVSLQRLKFPQLEATSIDDPKQNSPRAEEGNVVPEANPKTNLSQKSVGNSERLRFCEDCAKSFDSIFQQKRYEYVAPYVQLLQQEEQANVNAQKQLDDIDQKWNLESQEFARLSHELDKAMDNRMLLLGRNICLKLRVKSVSKDVSHDHNYAQTTQ